MTVAGEENILKNTVGMSFQRRQHFHGSETSLKIPVPNKHELYSVAKEVYFSTFSLVTLKMSRFSLSPLIIITPTTPIIFPAIYYKAMISLSVMV